MLLQETWSHVEFKFTQHKGTDVYLVKMAEEDFEALEDNQVLVQVKLYKPPARCQYCLLTVPQSTTPLARQVYSSTMLSKVCA